MLHSGINASEFDAARRKAEELLRKGKAGWNECWEQLLAIDTLMVRQHQEQYANLKTKHSKLTLSWAYADPDMQAVLRPELDKHKEEMDAIKTYTIPLTEKAGQLEKDKELLVKQLLHVETILAETDEREKAEAVRSLFTKIVLPFRRTLNRFGQESANLGWTLQRDSIHTIYH